VPRVAIAGFDVKRQLVVLLCLILPYPKTGGGELRITRTACRLSIPFTRFGFGFCVGCVAS